MSSAVYFANFNWGAFLLAVTSILLAAWCFEARRLRPGPLRIYLATAFLFTACSGAAAPLRGLLDPNYVGYQVGLLHARHSWPVTRRGTRDKPHRVLEDQTPISSA